MWMNFTYQRGTANFDQLAASLGIEVNYNSHQDRNKEEQLWNIKVFLMDARQHLIEVKDQYIRNQTKKIEQLKKTREQQISEDANKDQGDKNKALAELQIEISELLKDLQESEFPLMDFFMFFDLEQRFVIKTVSKFQLILGKMGIFLSNEKAEKVFKSFQNQDGHLIYPHLAKQFG